MDLTQIFKETVRAVTLRNNNTSKATPVPDKNRILQRRYSHNEFSAIAKDICYKITELRNLLIENRAAYMRFAQYLKNSSQMTDEERDIIDRETEKFINYYTQYIGQIRCDWRKQKLKKQFREHIENVLELLSNYLKAVKDLHMEQKNYRIQHELETIRFLKLASNKKLLPIRLGGDTDKNKDKDKDKDKDKNNDVSKQSKLKVSFKHNNTKNHDKDDDNSDYNNSDADYYDSGIIDSENDDDDDDDDKSNNKELVNDKKLATKQIAINDDDDQRKIQQNIENKLSPEDIQTFELENNQLYQELQGLSEEVEQIEKNVVDIARLQEVFTEKVTLQKHDIERIANVVVGTTENVKDANEQIKQAIQRNAGLRVWALFFLLVMSFTLLFLDWYNE